MGMSLAELGGMIKYQVSERAAILFAPLPPEKHTTIDEEIYALADRQRVEAAPKVSDAPLEPTDEKSVLKRSAQRNTTPVGYVAAALEQYGGEAHTHVIAQATGLSVDTVTKFGETLGGWFEYTPMEVGGILSAPLLKPQEEEPSTLPPEGESVTLLDNGPTRNPPPIK